MEAYALLLLTSKDLLCATCEIAFTHTVAQVCCCVCMLIKKCLFTVS